MGKTDFAALRTKQIHKRMRAFPETPWVIAIGIFALVYLIVTSGAPL